jgi:hypothetical protein
LPMYHPSITQFATVPSFLTDPHSYTPQQKDSKLVYLLNICMLLR